MGKPRAPKSPTIARRELRRLRETLKTCDTERRNGTPFEGIDETEASARKMIDLIERAHPSLAAPKAPPPAPPSKPTTEYRIDPITRKILD